MKREEAPPFDTETACQLAEAFARISGVPCRLGDGEGQVIYQCSMAGNLCRLCERWRVCGVSCRGDGESACANCSHGGMEGAQCGRRQLYGAFQAERFGGRYIFFCPAGMGWICVPVMGSGRLVGSLSAGPVLIMEPEDYLASLPALENETPERTEEFVREVQAFPYRRPEELSHMSLQLLASALYISDSSRALLEQRQSTTQQQDIGSYLQQLKVEGGSLAYPREKEKNLAEAVSEGNRSGARQLLNELLGYLFYSGGESETLRARSLELAALLSRAAADGGADLEQVLQLNRRFLAEGERLHTVEELNSWLIRLTDRYTSMVFDARDIRHKDTMLRAVNYMKQNLASRLTLDDTADYAALSPAYFSKTFKEEMGQPFNSYLNRLRINESKALLLATDRPLKDICAAVGYEDQSYFTKVFRKQTGVTPGQYRKKQGRLDAAKERGTGSAEGK